MEKRPAVYTRDAHPYGVIGIYSGGNLGRRQGWEADDRRKREEREKRGQEPGGAREG